MTPMQDNAIMHSIVDVQHGTDLDEAVEKAAGLFGVDPATIFSEVESRVGDYTEGYDAI